MYIKGKGHIYVLLYTTSLTFWNVEPHSPMLSTSLYQLVTIDRYIHSLYLTQAALRELLKRLNAFDVNASSYSPVYRRCMVVRHVNSPLSEVSFQHQKIKEKEKEKENAKTVRCCAS